MKGETKMKTKQYITETQAESKVYDLKEIVKYLKDCMKEPQCDTKVSFEINADGELTICTANNNPGWISATEFTVISREPDAGGGAIFI